MRLASQQQFSAAPVIVPSPLVGEGSTVRYRKLARERGRHKLPRLRLPLSRLRFAQAPSPTRGEGTIALDSKRTS